MTFATLKTDIAAWVKRSDLTAVIPSFVSLAETEIFKTHKNPLRVREMETVATISTLTLPTDFLEGISLKDANGKEILYAPKGAYIASGAFYTIVGNTISLPETITGDLTLTYYAQPAALSADGDTNSVLQAYYGIYLTASLIRAFMYMKDANAAAAAKSELAEMMSMYKCQTSTGQLAMRAV